MSLEHRRYTSGSKNIITKGAKGGGLVISDNHGEIPFQVKEETLHAIADAVKKWGHY